MMQRKSYRFILGSVAILAIGLLLVAGLAKNMIVREIVRRALVAETGLEVRIKSIKYNPFSTEIEMRGLTIMNPPEFGESVAIDLERVYIDTTLKDIFSSERVRIDRCELDIASIRLVMAAGGRSNLEAIIALMDDDSGKPKPGEPSSGSRARAPGPERNELSRELLPVVDSDEDVEIGSLEIRLREIVVLLDPSDDRGKSYLIDQTLLFEDVVDLNVVATQLSFVMLLGAGPELLKDVTSLIERGAGDSFGEALKSKSGGISDDLKNILK